MCLRLRQPEAPPEPPLPSIPAVTTAPVQVAGHIHICKATLKPNDALRPVPATMVKLQTIHVHIHCHSQEQASALGMFFMITKRLNL